MRLRAVTTIAWERDTLEWCVARRRAAVIECAERGEVPDRPTPEPDATAALVAAFAQIPVDRTAPLVLLLPARGALLRVLDLPAGDADECVAMARLQMDKLSPFPAEQSVTGVEVLSPGPHSARVLAATVRRESVEAALAAAEKAGHTPAHVDLDVLAWWRLLCDAGEIGDRGCEVHVRMGRDEIWLLVCSRGRPDLLRVLAGPFESAQDIREDMVHALAALDLERGEAGPGRYILWTDSSDDADLLAGVLPVGAPVPDRRRNEALPPLVEGGGKRALERTGFELLPGAWADRQRRRRQRRTLFRGAAALLSVWLLAIGAMSVSVRFHRLRFEREEAEVRERERPADDVRALIERTRSLEDYADRSRSAIEALRETARLLPPGITLTQFSYVKGRGVTLTGESAEAEIIYEYLGRLENSPIYSSVRPENVTSRGEGGATVSQFRVSAELRGGSS